MSRRSRMSHWLPTHLRWSYGSRTSASPSTDASSWTTSTSTSTRSNIVAIIGQSGGGKTTLMRCVNLLETPERADMEVAGEKIFSGDQMVCKDLAKLRQTVGMVFQRFNLFPHLTAVENIMLAQLQGRCPRGGGAGASRRAPSTGPPRPPRLAYPDRCPAGSSSGSRSPVPWRCSPRSCSSMSRHPLWIRSRPARCCASCASSPGTA